LYANLAKRWSQSLFNS